MKPSHLNREGKGADPNNFKSRACKTKGKKKNALSRVDIFFFSTRGTRFIILTFLCMYTKVKSESESHSVVSKSVTIGWNSPGQNTGVGSLSLLQEIFPTQGSNAGSLALQADSLQSEPQGKPKNTGMGSLSLLQGIFLSQGSYWRFLHCRQILYQVSYQESPIKA